MKLNRKGYMLVEIIVAAVLAMSIAYYLLNLTYKFKNTNEDVQESYYYTKDKILITKNIMSDLERGTIRNVYKTSDADLGFVIDFEMMINSVKEKRKLKASKNASGVYVIQYGMVGNDGNFVTGDISYYEKELERTLIVKNPEIDVDGDAFSVKIPISSLYTDNNYDIILLSPSYQFPLLSEVRVGSYVAYTGNNGCPEGHCDGTNANYVGDTNMGYCNISSNKFSVNGWRVGYTENGSAYLISAGAPECICTNSDGSYSNSTCSSYETTSGTPLHLANLNNQALKYCNTEYAYGGICNSTTAWSINPQDFKNITGKNFIDCNNIQSTECGYNNDLIDNGSWYWFNYNHGSSFGIAFWRGGTLRRMNLTYGSSSLLGLRPVIRMDSDVVVVGGIGTYADPYQIINK